MKMKIVADSSANLLAVPDIDFGVVPLPIIVGENDYIDDDKIDLTAMPENLSSYKGKTSTSSPSPTRTRSNSEGRQSRAESEKAPAAPMCGLPREEGEA